MKLSCVLLAAALGLCQAARAQEPLWELGVVGGVALTPAYPGSSDRSRRALALPFLIYRGDVWRADPEGIGARLVHRERVEFDVGLAASLPAHSHDVPARTGMPDLGTLVEAGPRLKLTLAQPSSSSRLRLDLPLRAVIESSSGMRRQGVTFEPKLVLEARGLQGTWSFEANAGMVFGDRKINRYFYEIRPAFATPARRAFEADPGLMLVRTGVNGSRMLNPDMRVFGFVRLDSYAGAANRDSPLLKRNTGVSAGFGLAWTIMRSAAMAK